jgi:lincosamide nucleotidyltransferase A/C/D/E
VERARESSDSSPADAEDDSAPQRTLIAALAATLSAASVRYWLMGGWAVDAHLGRTTRRHSDIDFAVFLTDRDALADALATHGLASVPGADAGGEFFEGGPCRVEITYLVQTSTGEVATPGFEHWPFIAGSFDADPVLVEGVAVPILSVESLIDTKQHWQDHIGEPMRPHDRADLEALQALP